MNNFNDRLAVTLTASELTQLIRQEMSSVLDERGILLPKGKEEDELLSIAALAKHLGRTKQSINNYRKRGFLPPPSYVGTRPRWSRNEVDEFMQNRKADRHNLK